MRAKDGLIVRLKISGGIVSAVTLRAIAQASRDYGNGHFDLSVRANLQMRGVREERLPLLIEALDRLGLIDETAAAEAVRNILVSPLSGLDGRHDAQAAAKALEAVLVLSEDLHALPAKFGFLIDDGSCLSLASVPADVRFDWVGGERPFAIGIGGRADEASSLGWCGASEIPGIASCLARAFLRVASQLAEPPRRMRELVESCGVSKIANSCGLRAGPPPIGTLAEPCPIGELHLDALDCFGAGVAFGHFDAGMLDAAASAAEIFGCGEIRLTPWRALIFPFVPAENSGAIHTYLQRHGFIVDREDLRLAVSICRGALTCEQGTTDTRVDALALMLSARRLRKTSVALHICGCAKGCARPTTVPLTLIARDGLYDLAVDDSAPDSGILSKTQLTITQVRKVLETLGAERQSEIEMQ
jgi:precorrin-3B synthase